MDTRKVRMLKEDAKSYTMHDGASSFQVAKAGLSDEMHKRIRAYAEGGRVPSKDAPRTTIGPDGKEIPLRKGEELRFYDERGRSPLHKRSTSDDLDYSGADDNNRTVAGLARGGPVRGYSGEEGNPEAQRVVDPMALPASAAPQAGVVFDANGQPIPSYNQQMASAMGGPPGGLANAIDRANLPPPEHPPRKFGMSAGETESALIDNPQSIPSVGAEMDDRDKGIDEQKMRIAAQKQQWKAVPEGDYSGPMSRKVPPPAAAPAQRRGGGGGPSADPYFTQAGKDFQAGETDQIAGADAKAKNAADLGAQMAAMHAGHQLESQRIELDRKRQVDEARTQTDDILSKERAAVEEMKNVNTTVDPGRYWASRSTGQKILGVIGLALGALGAGRDGINRSATMMQQAIDRDIDAQKAEYELALRKGKANVEGLQSMYAQARNRIGDADAAANAAKAAANDLVLSKVDELTSQNMGPAAQAQAQMFRGQLEAEKGRNWESLGEKVGNASLRKAQEANLYAEAEERRAKAAGVGKTGKTAGLAAGTHEAIEKLRKEILDNPTSTQIPRLRASVMLHLSKLQGGRQNPHVEHLNEQLVPGNEGWSVPERLKGAASKEWVNRGFQVLHDHAEETAGMPSGPGYDPMGDQ